METIGHLLALVGLASPLAISHFLDRILKAELKEKFAAHVFGASDQTVSQRVALFNLLLASALGKGIFRRTVRLLAIGVVSIVFVYSLQYFLNNEQFEKNTLPFLTSISTFRPFAIFVFFSFVCVDAISFFQTTTFARLAAYCRNPIEVMFLAFADIVVSLFLVLIFLPAFLYFSHRIATVPHPTSVTVALLESIQSQQLTIREIIRMAAPRISEPDELSRDVNAEAKAVGGNGWIYSNPRVFVGSRPEAVTIDAAQKGGLPTSGGTLLFSKGDMSLDEMASSVADLLKTNRDITKVRVLETSSDLFGNAAFSLTIEGQSSYSALSFMNAYSSIMRDVNFFGESFYDAISLGSKTFDENEITYNGYLTALVERAKGQVVVKCDTKTARIVDREEFLKLTDSDCSKGVAMSGWSVTGIATLLSYNLDNRLNIPVLPTALSSIFLTVLIYIAIISWILLPYLRSFAERYTDDGAKIIVDNVFTVSFCLLSVLVSPFIALAF